VTRTFADNLVQSQFDQGELSSLAFGSVIGVGHIVDHLEHFSCQLINFIYI